MTERRLTLTRAAKLLGLLGLAFALYPFLASLSLRDEADSERQRAWLRAVDLRALAEGELLLIDDWPGGPVAVYHRSAHEIEGLARVRAQLHDPDSLRSRQPEPFHSDRRGHSDAYFVFLPITADRGCQVRPLPANKQPRPDILWYGGFTDPCTGTLYDSAGRVYRDYRSEQARNLPVPHYQLEPDRQLQLSAPPPD